MRLSGRTQAPQGRRERKLAQRARGAPALTHHGPLQAMVRRMVHAGRGENMMIDIPSTHTNAPSMSHAVGRTPSTIQSQNIAAAT
jgi:hypothetical protein